MLHPELEFHPTALVGTGTVYIGIEGAGAYFDDLVAGGRKEQAELAALRRIAADPFLFELDLRVDGGLVGTACMTARLRDGKFVDTRGYLSDAATLAAAGMIPDDAPVVPGRAPA